MIYFFKSFSVNAYVYVYIFLNYYVITKRTNLYHKGNIFSDNIFTKNQQYFYVKLKIIKLFD